MKPEVVRGAVCSGTSLGKTTTDWLTDCNSKVCLRRSSLYTAMYNIIGLPPVRSVDKNRTVLSMAVELTKRCDQLTYGWCLQRCDVMETLLKLAQRQYTICAACRKTAEKIWWWDVVACEPPVNFLSADRWVYRSMLYLCWHYVARLNGHKQRVSGCSTSHQHNKAIRGLWPGVELMKVVALQLIVYTFNYAHCCCCTTFIPTLNSSHFSHLNSPAEGNNINWSLARYSSTRSCMQVTVLANLPCIRWVKCTPFKLTANFSDDEARWQKYRLASM